MASPLLQVATAGWPIVVWVTVEVASPPLHNAEVGRPTAVYVMTHVAGPLLQAEIAGWPTVVYVIIGTAMLDHEYWSIENSLYTCYN